MHILLQFSSSNRHQSQGHTYCIPAFPFCPYSLPLNPFSNCARFARGNFPADPTYKMFQAAKNPPAARDGPGVGKYLAGESQHPVGGIRQLGAPAHSVRTTSATSSAPALVASIPHSATFSARLGSRCCTGGSVPGAPRGSATSRTRAHNTAQTLGQQ